MTDLSGFDDPITPESFDDAMKQYHSLTDDPSTPIEVQPQTEINPRLNPNIRVEDYPTSPPEPESPTPPPTRLVPDPVSPPETITVDGQEIPFSLIQDMARFNAFLEANPEAAQRIQRSLDPSYQVVPVSQEQPIMSAPIPPTPQPAQDFQLPSDFDYEDPANRAILDNLNSLRRDLSQTKQVLEAQQQNNAVTEMNKGIENFTNKYSDILTTDDIQAIRLAGQNVFPGYINQTPRDISTAAFRSLEMAMWSIPEVRDKLSNHTAQITLESQKADEERQRKLTALAGGSGGNRSNIPAPEQTGDTRAAIIREIRSAMQNPQAS